MAGDLHAILVGFILKTPACDERVEGWLHTFGRGGMEGIRKGMRLWVSKAELFHVLPSAFPHKVTDIAHTVGIPRPVTGLVEVDEQIFPKNGFLGEVTCELEKIVNWGAIDVTCNHSMISC